MTEVGERFVQSLAIKDRTALMDLFADEVDFRGMTPGAFWEASTPDEVIDVVLLGSWFEDHDIVESVMAIETGTHVDRQRVDYRLRVRSHDDLCLVEQRGYFDLDGSGRIMKMNLICSGFRKLDRG